MSTVQNLLYVVPRQEHDNPHSRYRGLLLIGGPGGGKTSAAMSLLPGCPVVRIGMAPKTPEDMATYPVPIVDGDSARIFHALSESDIEPLLAENIGDGHGILLFDDIGAANERTQNALLEPIQFGRFGRYQLGRNVLCVLTTNGIEHGAFAAPLSSALCGRCQVVRWKADLDRWLEYPCNMGISPVVVAFLKDHPDMFEPETETYTDELGKRPAPREWTTLGHSIAAWGGYGAFERTALLQSQEQFVAATIGATAAPEFARFAEHYLALPSIEEILTNPDCWMKVEDTHRTLANGLSLAFGVKAVLLRKLQVAGINRRNELAKALRAILVLSSEHLEVVAFFCQTMLRYATQHDMTLNSELLAVCEREGVFAKAGIADLFRNLRAVAKVA